MKNSITKFAVLAALFMLNGCASILNPFESKFACPDNPKGKCISIKGAYNEDLASSTDGKFNPDDTLPATEIRKNNHEAPRQVDSVQEAPKGKSCCTGKPDTTEEMPMAPQPALQQVRNDVPVQEYRDASLKKVTKLLRDPVSPLVAPPHVMRVLILPYEDDDGTLNLQRFHYVMVDRPKWVLGDYLAKEEGGE